MIVLSLLSFTAKFKDKVDILRNMAKTKIDSQLKLVTKSGELKESCMHSPCQPHSSKAAHAQSPSSLALTAHSCQ